MYKEQWSELNERGQQGQLELQKVYCRRNPNKPSNRVGCETVLFIVVRVENHGMQNKKNGGNVPFHLRFLVQEFPCQHPKYLATMN